MAGRYVFDHTAAAARRLSLVAEVFDPPSAALLRAAAAGRPFDLAVDLGCGPGHTTRLVARTLRPRQTVGLDRADAFLDLARATATEAEDYVAHDVTRTPFPVGPADLLYCRFLLTHLTGHADLLARWATQLRPGGLLVIDEVDRIHTSDVALGAYLAALSAVLAGQGQRLEIGPDLHALPDPDGLRRTASEVRTVQPPAAQAARMFALNLTVWGTGDDARTLVGQAELDRIAAGLDALGRGERQAEITWGLRQIVWERLPA